MLDLDKLEALALAATPGKRYTEERNGFWELYAEQRFQGTVVHPMKIAKCPTRDMPFAEYWPVYADSSMMAALDRDTVLELIRAARGPLCQEGVEVSWMEP